MHGGGTLRDEHDINATSSYQLGDDWEGVGSQGFFVRKSIKSFRSESVSTPPLADGSYGHPTNYRAFRATTSSNAGEYRWAIPWDSSGGLKTRWIKYTGASDNDYWSWGFSFVELYPIVPNDVIARARSSVIAKIQANDLNLGTSLGELPETVMFILGTLRAIVRLLRIRNAFPGGAASPSSSAKAFSDMYLQYQYGVKPLMSDIHGALRRIEDGIGGTYAARVTSTATDSLDQPRDYLGRPFREVESYTNTCGCTVSLNYTVTNKSLFQLWRYGLTDPLAVAWELLPSSFVVDWFTGLGSFLGGLAQPMGLSVVDGFQTRWARSSLDWVTYYDPPGAEYRGGERPRCTVRNSGMHREVLNWVPPPLPYFDIGITSGQVTSLIAQLTGASTSYRR